MDEGFGVIILSRWKQKHQWGYGAFVKLILRSKYHIMKWEANCWKDAINKSYLSECYYSFIKGNFECILQMIGAFQNKVFDFEEKLSFMLELVFHSKDILK